MQHITRKNHDHYVEFIVSRPERLNSLGMEIAEELLACLKDVQTLNEFKVVVFRFPKVETKKGAFSIAGGDLRELSTLDEQGAYSYADKMSSICSGFEELEKPTILVADGALIGGGAELALAFDVVLGTEESEFVFKQMHIGLSTGYGSAERLIRNVGYKKACRWLYSTPMVSSSEAFHCGLLHHVFPSTSELDKHLDSKIAFYYQLGPGAWKTQKKMFSQRIDKEAQENEKKLFVKNWKNEEHKASLQKFIG